MGYLNTKLKYFNVKNRFINIRALFFSFIRVQELGCALFYGVGNMVKLKCVECEKILIGKQRRYCSKKCNKKGYYHNNQDKHIESSRKYYDENKEKVSQYHKDYNKRNSDKNIKYQKEYRKKKGDILLEQKKEYYKKNKAQILNQKKIYKRKRRKQDPVFRMNCNFSRNIHHSLKIRDIDKNRRRWEKIVSYTVQDLKQHLESLFATGMSWSNYGKNGWEIDHILPVSFFEYKNTDDVEFKMCWRLENLQPLWTRDNVIKSNKVKMKG